MAKMTLYNKYRDIRYLYPLFNLCKYIGAAPMVNIEKETFKKCRSYVYPLFLLCFTIAACILSFLGKMMIYKELHITVTVMDILCTGITAITCGFTIFSISIVKLDKVKTFFLNFKRYDTEHMIVNNDHSNNDKYQWFLTIKFELFYVHLYILGLTIHNIYFWVVHVGLDVYKIYTIAEVLQYQSFVSIFFLKNIMCCFKYRFLEINRRLCKFRDVCRKNDVGTIALEVDLQDSENLSRKRDDQSVYNLLYVHKVYQMYSELMVLVNMYNSIFGWQMMLLLLKMKLLLLFTLNLMVVYGDGTAVFGKSFGHNLWILGIMWASLILIESIAITWSSATASMESAKASLICYSILQHLHSLPKSWRNDEITEGIVCLSRLTSDQKAIFSAAGFFDINYTTFSTIIGTVTSYLIVLIQLK